MKTVLNKMTAIIILVFFLQSFCSPALAQEFNESYDSEYLNGPTTNEFEMTTEIESSSSENSAAGTGCDPLCPTTDDSNVALSGETSANFTTSYDYAYSPASTSINISSIDVSAGTTNATVYVNLSGNYSDITLEVRDASNNVHTQTSFYCQGYCSTSIDGLSPSSYYTVNVLTNGSNYVSGTASTSFNTSPDTTYAYYYDTASVNPTFYTNYVDIQSLNVSVSDSNPNMANVNFYNYGNTSSNLVLRLKDSSYNQISETYLGNCYNCSQDVDISGLAQGQTYYVEIASSDYNYVSFSGPTSTSFTVPEIKQPQTQVEGSNLEQGENKQPSQLQNTNNDTSNQPSDKPKPADKKPDLDKVKVNFIKLKNGKVNISATLAEARASINLYLEAGFTEAAGKLILELMNSSLIAALEIHEYISKMINGYTTAAGNQVPEDIKTATALIVGSLGIRASTPAQVISYLDILLALGDANKLRVPFPDSAEEIIVAANNVPLLSLAQGKPFIVTANNVTLLSFTQIKPYIDHFMAAGDLDRATRIIVAAIPKLLPANLEIEIAYYLDKFLALGDANQSRTPSFLHAEKILKVATTPPQRFRLVHVYIEECIQQGQMEIATNLIIHTYNFGMLDAFGLRFTIDRFLALGWYSEGTIHMDAAKALILEAIANPNKLGAVNVFTGEQIKIYLQILDSRNEVETASDIAKSALAAGLITAAEAQAYTSRI